jgi:hypothetical protein
MNKMTSLVNLKPNPDIVNERQNADGDIGRLCRFIGKNIFGSYERYEKLRSLSMNVILRQNSEKIFKVFSFHQRIQSSRRNRANRLQFL